MPLQSETNGDTIQLRSWCIGTVAKIYETTNSVNDVEQTTTNIDVDTLIAEATKLEDWMRRDDIHNKATVTPLSTVN